MAASQREICQWIVAAAPGGNLVSDSRQITPGDVFFAYPGETADGRRFIAQAVASGAAAVVHEERDFEWDEAVKVPHLAVPNLKAQAGMIAHAVLGQPDADMFTVGVTGTNGKTSCSVWLGQAFARLGETAAVIGTLGVAMFKTGSEPEFNVTGYTTPDAVLLASRLAAVREARARVLAIEVSSIGLVEGRTAGLHFDVAIFTNLTRDHLDYHGSMEAYEDAKRKLFEWPELGTAVVNLDDPAGQRLVAHLRATNPALPVIGYTLMDAVTQPAIDGVRILRASNKRSRPAGSEFQLETRVGLTEGSHLVKTRLVGHFNISNALAVLGALLAKGIELPRAIDAIEALVPAPGRMQQVGGQDAPLVVIDYAHTPDALEKTLQALRQVADERGGQLWCVFGCGGDRDPGKRPQMGAIAESADQVIVTSDNPRSEEPGAIIAQIVAGMHKGRHQALEDRATAILAAVKQANKQDVILLAGKGHEPYQEIKGKKLPFSDADHAALALTARLTMMRTH